MKLINGITGKTLRFVSFLALFSISMPNNAHVLGIAWNDIGNSTIRFYGEVAHDLTSYGFTEESATLGGGLQVGPWATRQEYIWTGIEIGATFEELGIDDYAYWDYTDDRSTILDYHPDSHRAGPGSSGNFWFVDVPNFASGDYVLSLFDTSALERPVSWNYLNAHITVPEPQTYLLFAIGLLALLKRHNSSNKVGG